MASKIADGTNCSKPERSERGTELATHIKRYLHHPIHPSANLKRDARKRVIRLSKPILDFSLAKGKSAVEFREGS
jgi:hypothetical protein